MRIQKISPCPICGETPEITWTAGMSKSIRKLVGLPDYVNPPCWIIRCDNCRVGVQAHVPYGTYECQQKMKQKAIRAWNKGVKMTIEEVMAKNSVNPIEDKTPSWETS